MSQAEATRKRILDAALSEFAAHGVAGARVDRIAATAGCNKNLLYIYFGSKAALFAAVLQQHLVRVYEDVPFTPDDLPGYAGLVFDFAMARPDLMRLVCWAALEQEQVGGPHPGRSASHEGKIAELDRAQAEDRLPAAFSPAFLVSTVMALATSWSSAFPFGSAMHPEQALRPDHLRTQVVEAVRRLTATEQIAATVPAARADLTSRQEG